MNARRHRRRSALALVLLSATCAAIGTAGATAAPAAPLAASGATAVAGAVPFTDPNAIGGITFCNARGEKMTGGNLADVPFVFRAVGDQAPPPPYNVKGGKATLYGFQPRKGVDPGDWSGQNLTASSQYSNPKFPMAAATTLDPSMLQFAQGVPPQWDGLVQVRLLVSAPGQPLLQKPYAAAVIRIVGNTWQLVQGGTANCWAGKAISQAEVLLPPDRFPKVTSGPAFAGPAPIVTPTDTLGPNLTAPPVTPTATSAPGVTGDVDPSDAPSAAPSATDAASGSTSAPQPTTTAAASIIDRPAPSSGLSPVLVVLLVGLAAVVGGGAVALFRRPARPAASDVTPGPGNA